MLNDISKLAKYGTTGIIIALIVLVGGTMLYTYKIVGNHINHQSEVMVEFTKVVSESIEVSRQTNYLIKDFRDELRNR